MITLTTFERKIQRVLIERARQADPGDPGAACLSYGELGHLVDPDGESHYPMTRGPFRGLNEALGHISWYEVEHGRPMLTALVVQQDTRHPGPGFGRMAVHLGFEVDDDDAFWRQELDEVIEFWSSGDYVSVVDAALDRVMDELGALKKLTRKAS